MGVGPLLAWRRTTQSALWRNLLPPTIAGAACALLLPLLGVRDLA